MKINRKVWAAVGVLGVVSLLLEMRSAASWRPSVVYRLATLPKPVRFLPGEIRFSRDGRWLLLQNGMVNEGVILDVEKGSIDANRARFLAFNRDHGLRDFPRFWFDERTWQLQFSRVAGRSVELKGVRTPTLFFRTPESSGGYGPAWSQPWGEVYCALDGVLWIWDWASGRLKKQVRYSKWMGGRTGFSPDGKWFVAEEYGKRNRVLCRYEVQDVRNRRVVSRSAAVGAFGFSPDSRLLWFTDAMTRHGTNFFVQQAGNGAPAWSGEASGPVKWWPDRVGIVGAGSFEWRRPASGQLLRRLPGPFDNYGPGASHIQDWAPSPDGKWIYSCDQTAVIRRWRAR